ncbi:hypothetical protein MCEREM21A_02195 [Sphingomonadaceae bacterium]
MRTKQSFNRLISNDENRRLGPKGRSFWWFWRRCVRNAVRNALHVQAFQPVACIISVRLAPCSALSIARTIAALLCPLYL